MALERIVCPECGKTMRPAKPVAEGQRVRCGGCQGVFVARSEEAPEGGGDPAPDPRPAKRTQDVPEEPRRRQRSDSDRADRSEDEAPRRRARADREDPEERRDDSRPRRRADPEREPPRKRGLLPLLIGGGAVLFLLVSCAGVGVYLLSGSSGFSGRQTDVTEADLAKVKQYATQTEVEAILGKGDPVDPAEYGILMGGGADWYGWRNGDDCLMVAFQKGKSGTLRVVGSVFVQQKITPNSVSNKPKFGIQPPVFGSVDVDAKVAERAALEARLADPRWLKGEAARKSLVGGWSAVLETTYQFSADGTCIVGTGSEKATGTYRFLDEGRIDLTVQDDSIIPGGSKDAARTIQLQVRLAQDEMLLIDLRFPAYPKTYKRWK